MYMCENKAVLFLSLSRNDNNTLCGCLIFRIAFIFPEKKSIFECLKGRKNIIIDTIKDKMNIISNKNIL